MFLNVNGTLSLDHIQINRLKSHFRHVRIETSHLTDSNKKKIIRQRTITGVGAPAHRITFEENDPKKGTTKKTDVAAFFKARYNITLKFPQLPCINIGTIKPVWIPAEIATIVEGQAYNGKLPDKQTASMIKIACRPPKENAEFITNVGLPRLGLKGENSHLAPFQMAVGNDMVVLPARILAPPTVTYSNESSKQIATWNLVKKRFKIGASMPNWSYMIINDGNAFIDPNVVKNTVLSFQKTCQDYGMNVKPPKMLIKGEPPLAVNLKS